MNGPENDRPLVALNAAEQALALERLRGETWQEFTRLNGVILAMESALKLQASEYERRLQILNHEAARIAEIQSESVTAEKFEGYKEYTDIRIKKVEVVADRLWLVSLVIGGVAAGIGAAVAKLMFP